MTCEIELRFVKVMKGKSPSFTKLINEVNKLQKSGDRLHWKPDKIELEGTTIGYLLYIQHDC